MEEGSFDSNPDFKFFGIEGETLYSP